MYNPAISFPGTGCFMRLLYRLLIVVALPAALIWQVGYYATNTSEVSLHRAVKNQSDAQARALMEEIERVIEQHVTNWQAYGTTEVVQETLRSSGEELDKVDDVKQYIEEQNRVWSDADSSLSRELSENDLSKELVSMLDKFQSVARVIGIRDSSRAYRCKNCRSCQWP